MLSLEHLSKTYADGTRALSDINLLVQEGEIVSLIGGSGCGLSERRRHVIDERVVAQLRAVAIDRERTALPGEPDHPVEHTAIGGAGLGARAIHVREPQGDAVDEPRPRCGFEGAFRFELVRVVNGDRHIRRALVERVGRPNAALGDGSREDHRRGMAVAAGRIEHAHQRGHVREVVGLRILLRDGDAGLRRQMKYGADASRGSIEGGRLAGVRFEKMRAEYVDGRRKLIPTGEEVVIPCDDVLMAIGQENAFPWIEADIGLEFDQWHMPKVDRTTMMSTLPAARSASAAARGIG